MPLPHPVISAALHEASHAVVGLALGITVHRVSVDDLGGGLTRCEELAGVAWPLGVMAAAGPVYECASQGVAWAPTWRRARYARLGCARDYDLMLTHVGGAAGIPYAMASARAILDRHGTAVTAIARALAERGAMGRTALARLVRRHLRADL